MENKQDNIIVIAIIILIFSVTSGIIGFFMAKKLMMSEAQRAATPIVAPVKQPKQTNQSSQQNAQVLQKSSLRWDLIQFDGCGNYEKYEKMPWWNSFSNQVGKYNYYSGVICDDGKEKKLSIDDFVESGEGCLSEDKMAFIAVFPGEYMGDGNHIFRYDINENILEEAKKTNEAQAYGTSWSDPPISFGKRTANIIKMTGRSGDAGCWSDTEFDYDIVKNQIKMTKRCVQCEGEKQNCESF